MSFHAFESPGFNDRALSSEGVRKAAVVSQKQSGDDFRDPSKTIQ